MQYLVMVDRYSSWTLVYRATYLSVGELVRILSLVFAPYKVAEEFTLDVATVFTGYVFAEFCKTWVQHRASSALHPNLLETVWIWLPSLSPCCRYRILLEDSCG